MSLQGDLGGWSSGGGKGGNIGGNQNQGKGGSSTEDYKNTDYYNMMTGTGTTATSSTGDTVRSKNIAKGAVPEYVNTPDGLKYVGSKQKYTGQSLFNRDGYRSTVGTSPGFFSGLFGNKNPMGSITTRINPTTGQLEYYSEEEDVGEAKPGMGGRLLGGLASLLTGIPVVGGMIGSAIDKYKPKGYFEGLDTSEQRRLNALNLTPFSQQKISLTNDVPMESLTMANWGKPNNTNNQITNTTYPGDNRITQSVTGGPWNNFNDYLEQDLSTNVVNNKGLPATNSFSEWDVNDEALYP